MPRKNDSSLSSESRTPDGTLKPGHGKPTEKQKAAEKEAAKALYIQESAIAPAANLAQILLRRRREVAKEKEAVQKELLNHNREQEKKRRADNRHKLFASVRLNQLYKQQRRTANRKNEETQRAKSQVGAPPLYSPPYSKSGHWTEVLRKKQKEKEEAAAAAAVYHAEVNKGWDDRQKKDSANRRELDAERVIAQQNRHTQKVKTQVKENVAAVKRGMYKSVGGSKKKRRTKRKQKRRIKTRKKYRKR